MADEDQSNERRKSDKDEEKIRAQPSVTIVDRKSASKKQVEGNRRESKAESIGKRVSIVESDDDVEARLSIRSIVVPTRTSRSSRRIENENLAAEYSRHSRVSVPQRPEYPNLDPSVSKVSINENVHSERDATKLWSSMVSRVISQNRRRKSEVRHDLRVRSTTNFKTEQQDYMYESPRNSKETDILPFSRSVTRTVVKTNPDDDGRVSTYYNVEESIPTRIAITHPTTDTNIRISDLVMTPSTRRRSDRSDETQMSVSSTALNSIEEGKTYVQPIPSGNTVASDTRRSERKESNNRSIQEQKSKALINRSVSSERVSSKSPEDAANNTTKNRVQSSLSIESDSDLDSLLQLEDSAAIVDKFGEPDEFKQLPPPKSVPETNSNHDNPVDMSKMLERDSSATFGSMYLSQPSNLKLQQKGRLDESPSMSDFDQSIYDVDSDAVSLISELQDMGQQVQRRAGSRISVPFEKGMPVAIYRQKTSRDRNQTSGAATYTAARQLVSYAPAPRFRFDSEYRNLKQSIERISKLPRSHDSTEDLLAQTNDPDAPLVRFEDEQMHHFRSECLEIHNKLRELHSVQPLLLEYDMCDHAQQWAEHLAKSNSLKNKKDLHGQNLFLGIGPFFNAYTVVKTWYDQMQYYAFDNPCFTYETGHFTQLVWKTTKWLGVGLAKRGQRVWVVCNYSPCGNMLGTFRENVRPAKIILKTLDPKKQQEEFIQTCVQVHNQLRARHRVPPLILSPSISSHAMEWAQELAAMGTVKYRPGNRYGENLFVASNFQPTAEEVVKDWYSEILAYNFKQPGFSLNTGNFTQLVWKKTMEIGVGITRFGPSTIVVCNYNPPGNYTGGFIENVLEIRERNEQYKVLYHSKAPTNKTMEYENNLPIEDQIFLSHNRYRSYHGCPPLVINEELTNLANQWAQYLMESNVFKNRPNNKFGENLFYSSGLNITGDTCVKAWYIEIRKYNANKPVYNQATRNFTQLIWKDTKELGIGVAFRDRYTYIVCNYNPCGNVAGQFTENVPKIISVIDAPYLSIDQRGQKVRGHNEDGTRYRIEPTGKTFEEQCLNAHNRYRALHNCPPLILNNELSLYATEWAKHVSNTNSMTHRPNNIYGENLYFAVGFTVTGEDPVAAWYNEVEEYDFGRPGFHTRTGHFTQVIWCETEQLGVGVFRDQSKTFVVCNYYPHGNVVYTFKENVPPPLSLQSIPLNMYDDIVATKPEKITKQIKGAEETPSPANSHEFQDACLKAHNKYRSLHGCPSLRINRALSQNAQEWAQHLSKSLQLYHKPNNSYGENDYMAQGFRVKGHDPVKIWYDEIFKYNFNKPKFSRATANFTQMIWRFSEFLGVGVETIEDRTYVVCFYNPYGNINEKFSANVPRPLTMAANEGRLSDSLHMLSGSLTTEFKARIANRFLKLHNAYRCRHNCPPLELKESLMDFAQEWADHLASENILEHRPLNKDGANIFKSNGWNITPDDVMKIWYSEIKNFNFGHPEININTSHFTQIIWCNTEFLGIGVAKNNKKSVWIVCNYLPPGNHTDELKYNVPPPL